MRAYYRFTQGLRALAAGLRPVDDSLAEQILAPSLYALYRQMRRSERQHSLRVLHDLRAEGHSDPDLLIAALLHDVGKTRFSFTVPEKVLVVLVKAFAPHLYWRWGNAWESGTRSFWQRPFAISVQHPVWGAEMAARAGASARAATFIRDHAGPLSAPPQPLIDPLLAALMRADNRN